MEPGGGKQQVDSGGNSVLVLLNTVFGNAGEADIIQKGKNLGHRG